MLFACALLVSSALHAQKSSLNQGANSFVEFNGGLALIDEGSEEFVFPGVSVLFGDVFINEKNLVLEYQFGLAAPSLVTGKIGFGGRLGNTVLTTGVRVYPFNIYFQSAFGVTEKGFWAISVEANPLDSEHELSFQSAGLFTVGYRLRLGGVRSDELFVIA